MNPGQDPSTLPGYDLGVIVGMAIPILAIVAVLGLTVWGLRSIIVGTLIVRATDARIKAHRRS